MKAMIFAAGLGTRLRPLTDNLPKAMVKVAGRPLLEWNIRRLINFGYTDIIINVHYLADQIEDFVSRNNNFGINIVFSDERGQLLDTGGGLKKASWFLASPSPEPILVINADILTYLDLGAMRTCFFGSRQPLGALLAVQERPSSRRLLFFDNMAENRLCGWENVQTGQVKWASEPSAVSTKTSSWAFSGVQLIAAGVLQDIPLEGVFSMVDLYLQIASQITILPYLHTNDWWADIGKPENIAAADAYLSTHLYGY